MTYRLHHTQIKQAARLGITLEASAAGYTAVKDNKSYGPCATVGEAIAGLLALINPTTREIMADLRKSKPKAKKKVAKRKARKSDDEEFDEEDLDGDDESDADQGHSVVKAKYKAKYKPHKGKCGDNLSYDITEHVTVEDEDGKKHVDHGVLKAFAEANGVWIGKYDAMLRRNQAGLVRMNVANRLRGLMRRDKEFKIRWEN